MAEMNDLAKKWVDALLSGAYQQGKYALRTEDNKFCCLGVLADVADPNCWGDIKHIDYVSDPNNSAINVSVHGYTAYDYSAESIPDWLWKAVTEGALLAVDFDQLATANDEGRTFEQIIEEYILPMWDDEWEGQEPSYD